METMLSGTLKDETVHVEPPGRERFYDSRGYGRPDGDGLVLDHAEAAHLIMRGDLAVQGMDIRSFLDATETLVPFLVYKDLRERGFYLSPARESWIGPDHGVSESSDFVVYPRGSGPWDGEIEYPVQVSTERESIDPARLRDGDVLAVVDEESEITYFAVDTPEISGSTDHSLPTGVSGTLLSDRVLLWDPPASLYENAFYGQPLTRDGGDGSIQCSLVEGAYLADQDIVLVNGIEERGRAVSGERFDRRLVVYTTLRNRGIVPKTGYKFGADFRTYANVESVEDLGHSETLVRVLPADQTITPRDLALDVRLAHGVRKTMVFALVDGEDVTWRSVSRLTP